jgi:RNA-directed DNA polymerase
MNEGKLMNVSHSTISAKDKSLTNTHPSQKWKSIEWHLMEKSVNKLQVRITKAVKQNKWHKVKRLEYLLTHSYSAKLLAVRKVTQNKGKRTAGIDGGKWLTPKSKMLAALSLTGNRYKAQPLKRVFINKAGKKKRPLGIPTMYDRAMQCLYSLALEPIAETTSDSRSFGFRKFRSTKDSCQQIFRCLSKKNSAQWILEGDIKGCFDHINHQWLLDNIPIDKSILTQFLKAGFVYKRHLNPTKAGTPQGGIISPILANMALDGIENLLLTRYPKRGRKYCKVNFVRYADDFVVTADSEETAHEIKELLKTFLKERGLELSDDKTLITNITEGFDFLGWNFRKYRGKLLIKPSRESIQKFVEKISQTVKAGKGWSQEFLIAN